MRLRILISCHFIRWITFPFYTYTQSFIANPGFEEYVLCPEGNLDEHQIANWNFSFPPSERTTAIPWFYQSYHHICDRDVSVYWKSVLGNGVLRVPFRFDTTTDEVKTALLWTQLLRLFEKDSLYYIEYTTAPNLFYYPPDETFYPTWCVSPTLSISLMDETIPDLIDFWEYTNKYVLPQTTFSWNDGIEGVKRTFAQSVYLAT